MTKLTPCGLTPGFMVVHANFPEQLQALLVQWLRAYPLPVFQAETVLVQSNGIAQWLKMALAAPLADGGLGIAANMDFVMPHRMVWQLYRCILADEQIPLQCAFDKASLRWRLLGLLPTLLHDPVYTSLADYLATADKLERTAQLAEKIADLFDQYQVYRADWLQAWQQGQDVLFDAAGLSQPIPQAQQWQPALWRAILADMQPHERQFSRAGLHQRFLTVAASLNHSNRPVALPERLVLFGISSLSQQSLQALAAIAPFCQILLTVHNPCQYYWADIVADKDLFRHTHHRHATKQDGTHPLLAAWGKQGRDYIRLLDEFDQTESYKGLFQGERIDLFSPHDSTHLLGRLQQDILELRPVQASKAQWPAFTASQLQTIQFVSCHNVVRELEVLHDDILQALSTDKSLKYGDFMIMVPDIEDYAAAIHAVFGRYGRDDNRYIPFTIADQQAGAEQPLFKALHLLLKIRQHRLTVSELIDLFQVPAVAKRFALSPADVESLADWLIAARAHWGLHAAQRQSVGVEFAFDDFSLMQAAARMLFGYAFGESFSAVDGVLPLSQVQGIAAESCGQLAQLLLQLDDWWQAANELKTPVAWQLRLQQLVNDFFQASDDADTTLLTNLRQALMQWLQLCEGAQFGEMLPLSVVTDAWLGDFNQQNVTQRFLNGAVNFATLLPMRAIPFRQVHLLGMQDGAFPRVQRRLDFDLMSQRYRPGDRSRREDDRYLMLEALLSARDRLRISWIGRSVHDNSTREPSVLVAQLRQHLQQAYSTDNGIDLRNAITCEYPLKPYSQRYQHGEFFSYAREWALCASPKKQTQIQRGDVKGIAAPNQSVMSQSVAIEQIRTFLRDPVSWFFQQRLKVYFANYEQTSSDDEMMVPDALALWQLRQRVIDLALTISSSGIDVDTQLAQSCQLLTQQGALPLGGAGRQLVAQLQQELQPVLASYNRYLTTTSVWRNGFAKLCWQAPTWNLLDYLTQVRVDSRGQCIQLHMLAQPIYKDGLWQLRALLPALLQLLAGSATKMPVEQRVCALDLELRLEPIAVEDAQRLLNKFVAAMHAGLLEPLPFHLGLAGRFCQTKQDDKQFAKLQAYYEGDGFSDGVLSGNPYLQRAFADFACFWTTEAPILAEDLLRPLLNILDRAKHQAETQDATA